MAKARNTMGNQAYTVVYAYNVDAMGWREVQWKQWVDHQNLASVVVGG